MTDKQNNLCDITEEDLRAALRDLKTFVDVTEEDLKTIFAFALQHARLRMSTKIPVRDVMTKDVITARRDTDLHAAADLLSRHRISGMPVLDDQGRVLGVISEADILAVTGLKREHTFKDIIRHLLGEPLPSHKRGERVADLMNSPAITVSPDDDIRQASTILDERRIKRLPVVDAEGKLAGIISRADVVRAMSKKP